MWIRFWADDNLAVQQLSVAFIMMNGKSHKRGKGHHFVLGLIHRFEQKVRSQFGETEFVSWHRNSFCYWPVKKRLQICPVLSNQAFKSCQLMRRYDVKPRCFRLWSNKYKRTGRRVLGKACRRLTLEFQKVFIRKLRSFETNEDLFTFLRSISEFTYGLSNGAVSPVGRCSVVHDGDIIHQVNHVFACRLAVAIKVNLIQLVGEFVRGVIPEGYIHTDDEVGSMCLASHLAKQFQIILQNLFPPGAFKSRQQVGFDIVMNSIEAL